MRNVPVPSMSTAGWINDPTSKLDRLLSYYFTSLRDQDALHRDVIKSAQYDLAVSSYKPSAAVDTMADSIKTLMSPYFSSVTVSVTTNADTVADSQATVFIVIEFSDTGYTDMVSYVYDPRLMKFTKVVDQLQ